jgi:hypothetical protein
MHAGTNLVSGPTSAARPLDSQHIMDVDRWPWRACMAPAGAAPSYAPINGLAKLN